MKEIYDIIVTKDKDHSIFSRYQLSNILKYIGIKENIAMELAKEANKIILNEKDFFDETSNTYKLTSDQLCGIIKNLLLAYEDKGLLEKKDAFPEKYIFWRNVRNKVMPLLILIGGGTGVGSTYIARNLATKLNSIMEAGQDKYRIDKKGMFKWVSTDDTRAILRPYFSREFLPELKTSTYNAWELSGEEIEKVHKKKVIRGFLKQVESMRPALNALIQENIINNDSCLIMEGIHILPKDKKIIPIELKNQLYVSWYLITLENKEIHTKRLELRQKGLTPRSQRDYLKYFKQIRYINDFLKERAIAKETLIFDSEKNDITVKIMDDLFNRLKFSKRYDIRNSVININREFK